MSITITLPWPDSLLSPNTKAHWAKKAKMVKIARHVAQFLTRKEITLDFEIDDALPVLVHYVFNPPTHHKRDDDNLEASCKAYRDGIADALGVDDNQFIATREMGVVGKPGSVVVTIKQIRKEAA